METQQTIPDRIAKYKEWRKTHPDTHTNEEKTAIRKSVRQRLDDWKNKQSRSRKYGSPLQSVTSVHVTPVPVYTGSTRKSNGGKSIKQKKTKRPKQTRKQKKSKK